MSSRHGKHDDGLVSFSGRVTPEFLAIVKLTSVQLGLNGVELMKSGIISEATRAGIISNGKITSEFLDAYHLQLEIIKKRRMDHLSKKGKNE